MCCFYFTVPCDDNTLSMMDANLEVALLLDANAGGAQELEHERDERPGRIGDAVPRPVDRAPRAHRKGRLTG